MELMLRAPFLVCILVAGADGTIDKKEIKTAIQSAQKKKQTSATLASYFRDISVDFEETLRVLIQSYPYEATQRNPLLTEEISALNEVLPKLDKVFAQHFYQFLLDLASSIANSSGGFLGLKKIGPEEEKYLKLPMLRNPA
jgi:hypothetical protein